MVAAAATRRPLAAAPAGGGGAGQGAAAAAARADLLGVCHGLRLALHGLQTSAGLRAGLGHSRAACLAAPSITAAAMATRTARSADQTVRIRGNRRTCFPYRSAIDVDWRSAPFRACIAQDGTMVRDIRKGHLQDKACSPWRLGHSALFPIAALPDHLPTAAACLISTAPARCARHQHFNVLALFHLQHLHGQLQLAVAADWRAPTFASKPRQLGGGVHDLTAGVSSNSQCTVHVFRQFQSVNQLSRPACKIEELAAQGRKNCASLWRQT